MVMLYSSTRTNPTKITFDEAVLAGLAPDGGLYLPERLPHFSATDLCSMKDLNYTQLAARIMLPFMGEGWNETRLMPLLEQSYAVKPPNNEGTAEENHHGFRHPDIAPLEKLTNQHYVLELFHGPTLAFKDFALQFLGNVLGDILAHKEISQSAGTTGSKITVVGATSGDTGSAAIAGLAGQDAINIHILFPDGRVSDVQRRQMTTVAAPNVHALAIDGTFDDCQAMVKAMFNDAEFNKQHHLVAVNSINWARIMAQIVYYFYAALKLGAPKETFNFSVPTGNFGDIYAGWLAKHMGLPVGKLIIATNSNDILTRCWQSGDYQMTPVMQTLSPSMDIQISSNFERLLYGYLNRDGQSMSILMQLLKDRKIFSLPDHIHDMFMEEFSAKTVDDSLTKQTIANTFKAHGMLLDPHTAIGVAAAEDYLASHPRETVVTLATAHPAKFPDAVRNATGQHPDLPPHMKNLFDLPEKQTRLANKVEVVQEFISSRH